jgi:rhomboid protease GluP
MLITGEMLAAVVPREHRREFEQGLSYWQPMTVGVIALLVVVFIWQLASGALGSKESIIGAGALVQKLVREGEVWRLFSAVFLHGGFEHLIGNCMALYVLGIAVEHAFGKVRSLWIFLASGLCGSLLSVSLSEGPSVGASGAIFGLMGSAIIFFYKFRKEFFVREKRLGAVLVVWAVYSIITGFMTPMIDNWAHIGGLIGGVLATLLLRPRLAGVPPRVAIDFWRGTR